VPHAPRRSSIRSRSAGRLGLALALTVTLPLLLAACGGGGKGYPQGGELYTVRGQVERLPTPADRDLWIRHEAVPNLRGISGKVVGMDSMTMPFDLGPGELPAGLAVGDKIRFDLHVDWQSDEHPVWVGNVEELPPDTRLAWDQPAGAASRPK